METKLFTHYSLLITFYSILVTFFILYSLHFTHYSLLFTRYSLLFLVTRYILLVTRYFLHVTRYFLPVTRYVLLVTRYFLLVTFCSYSLVLICYWVLLNRQSLRFIRTVLHYIHKNYTSVPEKENSPNRCFSSVGRYCLLWYRYDCI